MGGPGACAASTGPAADQVQARRTRWRTAALAAGCAVLFLAGSARIGVVDRDEARFALAVREMAQRGDWIIPTNFGELRFQKPILVYWLAGGSRKLLGPSVLALRLPSAVCAMLAVLLTAAAARRYFGEGVGWHAGWILATSLLVVVDAHALTADAALLLGTTASFWAWARLREGRPPQRRWQALFWIGVAWGALAKLVNVGFLAAAGCADSVLRSPGRRARVGALVAALGLGALAVAIPGVGFLGPGLVALLLLVFLVRSLRSVEGRAAWEALGWRWGLPLALALFAPWGMLALLRTQGRFLQLGVGWELLGQMSSPFEGHTGPPGYYLLATPLVFFPWGALLPRALARAWSALRTRPPVPFLLAWVLGPWVLDELTASKLPHYMLVTFPALAVLVALETQRPVLPESRPARGMRLLEALLAGLPCVALAAAGAFLAAKLPAPGIRTPALAFVALALAVGGWWVRGLLRGTGGEELFRMLGGGATALFLFLFLAVFPSLERIRIAAPLAAAVQENLRPGERVLLYHFEHASVGYALPVTAEVIEDPREVVPALRAKPTLLVVPNGSRDPRFDRILAEEPFAYEHVATVKGYVLWRLREQTVWLVRAQRDARAPEAPTRPRREDASGDRGPGYRGDARELGHPHGP
jgi:4-amino-4-deoxy-L-arabinose transferase-like glycosyltransferase